ncbi:hypothetical protein OF83DRAFT_917596 [Amylostereum chailletii]|nr:hypothetical protein OF83DRAFT_917596 [Amylostereum chailletii]
MSALDLHYSIFAPEPSFSPPPSTDSHSHQHSRQLSSLSTTTVTTSRFSQPTDPLLPTVDSDAYHDMLSRQPLHPDGRSPRWHSDLRLTGDPITAAEKRGYWERSVRRRLRRLRTVKGTSLLVIAVWSVYTAVRYFVAYALYTADKRRAVALTLGTASLVCFSLTCLSASRRFVPAHFLFHHPERTARLRRTLRSILQLSISILLFIPTVVNLALVIAWRHSPIVPLSLAGRCHWDLDVAWIGVGGQCVTGGPAWGVWLIAALARLVLTCAVLVVYHVASHAYDATRRSSPRTAAGDSEGKTERRSAAEEDARTRQEETATFALQRAPHAPLHRDVERPSAYAAPHPAVPLAPPVARERSAVIPDWLHHSQSHSQGSTVNTLAGASSDDELLGAESSDRTKSLHRPRTHGLNTEEGHGTLTDADLQGFAERFRNLLHQVSHDFEEARRPSPTEEDPPSPVTPPIHHVLDTHTPYMSVDEFGREVQSEESIAVLGRVVRRMPTIESVGSREAASAYRQPHSPAATSSVSQSRPPTRATTLSVASSPSQPPSRANSLSYAPRMASELGELPNPVRASGRGSGSTASSFHTAQTSGTNGTGSSRSASGSTNDAIPSNGYSNGSSLSMAAMDVLGPVSELSELPRGGSQLGTQLSDALQNYAPGGDSGYREWDAREGFLTEVGERRPSPSSLYYSASTGATGTSSSNTRESERSR